MATSSLTGGAHTPRNPSGTDLGSLGPSDLSDSGSDVGMGAFDREALDSDSDSLGTGERAAGDGRSPASGTDILPDHLEGAPVDDELQARLDFEDERVAEEAEDAAGRDLDDPLLDDTPADVAGLSQEEGADPTDIGDGDDAPAASDPRDVAQGGGGPGHDIGRG